MDKRFLLILAALVIIFGGIFFFTKSKSTAPGTNGNNSADGGSSNIVGANTEQVTLVEFGDFQCPACAQYYPIMKQVKAKYGDQIAFQFRHFPLVQIHPNAMVAARAAQAAANQDKFWEMHDLLYENQTSWGQSSNPTAFFEQYAAQLGLNVETFKQDMNSAATLAVINADVAQGQSFGATGTPTFVLNGKKIESPNTAEGFFKLIDEAIAQNNQ